MCSPEWMMHDKSLSSCWQEETHPGTKKRHGLVVRMGAKMPSGSCEEVTGEREAGR